MKLRSRHVPVRPRLCRQDRVLFDGMEARILFSFVIHPTGNDAYAQALASSGAGQSIDANPASATDSSNSGTTSSRANANYQATADEIVLHADATETSSNDSSGTPGYAESQGLVNLSFTLTAASTIAISGNLSAGDGGNTNEPQGLSLSYSDGTILFDDFGDQPTALPATLDLPAGDYHIYAGATAYYNFVAGTKSSSADLTISITATDPTGTPPQITSANAATFQLGQPSAFTVTTTGDPAPGITETAVLPDGISFVDNGDGTATLSGTPSLLDATGNYDLILTASNGVPVDSADPSASQFFTLTLAGAPVVSLTSTHLVFGQQPKNTDAGATLAPVTVLILDKQNHLVTADDSTVSLTLGGTAGGALQGTAVVEAVDGVATFSPLSLTKAGTYSLTASDGTLKGAKSKTFTIAADPTSAHMVLSGSSLGSVLVGKPLTAISATLEDQFGNILKSNNSAVTMVVLNGPANGTVNGTKSVRFKNGMATFKNLWLSQAGSYTLQLSDSTLPGIGGTSSGLSVTVNQAAATIASPHPLRSYKASKSIALSTMLKSNAPAAIPLTGSATITDQNHNVLETATVGAKGALRFLLAGLAPGIYVCNVNYLGDSNHAAATSAAFTLNVTA
jgi:hypothetical protein